MKHKLRNYIVRETEIKNVNQMDCKHLFRRKESRTLAYSCSAYLAVCLLPGSTWLYALSLSFAELSAKHKCADCKCRCYVFRLSAVNLFTCV